MDDYIKQGICEFAGSRILPPELIEIFKQHEVSITEPIYRGMMFPKHLILEGQTIEEWHGSTHWSRDKNIAMNFAKNGYINEDYYDTIADAIGDCVELFVPIIFVLNSEVKGVELYRLLKEINEEGYEGFIREQEITLIGKNFKIEEISKEQDVYYAKVILNN